MAEYIGCRDCGSPNCKGCNIYTLATMLNAGKFDCLMNGNRAIRFSVDVAPVVHGRWGEWTYAPKDAVIYQRPCLVCGKLHPGYANYCPSCGARMGGDSHEG